MTIKEALNQGYQQLEKNRIETSYLDASVLLSHVLNCSREKLIANFTDEIHDDCRDDFQKLIQRRIQGIPVSYLRQKKEFYSLEFFVDNRVLVPRPDTEILVDLAFKLIDEKGFSSVHDLCTGSGCIPISLKKNRPNLDISASDISPQALEVFEINCRKILGQDIPHFQSDFTQKLKGKFHMITANPPYLSQADVDNMAEKHWPEPFLALLGGIRGDEMTLSLIHLVKEHLAPGGYFLCESDPRLMESLLAEMRKAGYTGVDVAADLAGRGRVVYGRLGL
ncbi:MAG: peptide chain release factor N(5)-glutamine methyltransferase [Spirochaetales bacterium]|nr:peptide chain release factor N(5)-glutamine methyltransferase [Spirochaetales bacterium]